MDCNVSSRRFARQERHGLHESVGDGRALILLVFVVVVVVLVCVVFVVAFRVLVVVVTVRN